MAKIGFLTACSVRCGQGLHIVRKSQAMLSIAMRTETLFAGILALGWMVPAMAEPLPPLVDPIFHLTIPSSVYESGFKEVPQAELKACGMIVKDTASYRYWVLASMESNSTEYLMITGAVKDGPGAP